MTLLEEPTTDLLVASAVEPAPMRMLWRDRIPAGTLSVIAGPPGIGKSSLIAFVVADLSRKVVGLISNAEDDPSSVTRPRLDVAGTIVERVHLVPPDATPDLPAEIATLRAWIRETDARYVVLDPIAAHFNPERRVHERSSLRKLAQLARETGAAIIGVHHTTKGFQVGGPNSGLIGTARAVYVYGYDPDDEDRRALECKKINGADAPAAMLFSHETVEYDAGGQVIEAGKLRKVRESNAKASRTRGKRDPDRDAHCHEWLSKFLAEGEDCARRSRDVRTVGAEEGYSWETVRRAKTALEVELVRIGFGGKGYWLWRLPDAHPLRNPEPAEEALG